MEFDISKSRTARSRVKKEEHEIVKKIKCHPKTRDFVAKYTPVIFIVVLLIVGVIFILEYNHWKKEGIKLPSICFSDSDCGTGYLCYNSRECNITSEGTSCGEWVGDRKCHATCMVDMDCGTSGTCEEVQMANGAMPWMYKMCMQG
jgi:hypothetical protein